MTSIVERIRSKPISLTVRAFCSLTDYSPITVYNWGKRRPGRAVQNPPKTVLLLLDAWERAPWLIPREDVNQA